MKSFDQKNRKRMAARLAALSAVSALALFTLDARADSARDITIVDPTSFHAGLDDGRIYSGVRIGDIDVSGMTAAEAQDAVNNYLSTLYSTQVTLVCAQDERVNATFGELGPVWGNPDVVDEALSLAATGNVIERYKLEKDIAHNGMEFPLEVSFDEETITAYIENYCSIYDIPVENPTLKKENGSFVVIDGSDGMGVNVEASVTRLQDELYDDYLNGISEIDLVVEETKPDAAAEDLRQIHDLLGTFTTSYSTSGANRSANVENGCRLINGTVLYPGEEFSAYNAIKPFSTANGYYLAGSYLNGQVVESLGGGICQVSSTLYNAVLRAELQVTERHNHSMVVTYVQKSGDAAIAESSGKDFRFINSTDYPIYIEGYCSGKQITFNIYGVESRDPGRSFEFVSEVLSETPVQEIITVDPSQPAGYVSVGGSPHTGYKARLWKVVYENGVEVERVEINSSSYAMSPRTCVVGVGSANADYANRMMAAAASGSISVCQAEAASVQADFAAAQAAAQAAAEAAALAAAPGPVAE